MVKGASTEEFPPSDRSVGVSLIEKKKAQCALPVGLNYVRNVVR